jgi:serine/threonine protein kinase
VRTRSPAIDEAHRKGIVHRDRKLGNVMLTRSGVRLLDFGLDEAETGRCRERLERCGHDGECVLGQGTILGALRDDVRADPRHFQSLV